MKKLTKKIVSIATCTLLVCSTFSAIALSPRPEQNPTSHREVIAIEDVILDQEVTFQEQELIASDKIDFLGDVAIVSEDISFPSITRSSQRQISGLNISGGSGSGLIVNNRTVSRYSFIGILCMVLNNSATASGEVGICYYNPRSGQYVGVSSTTLPGIGRQAYFGVPYMDVNNSYACYFKGSWTRAGSIYFYDYTF